MEITAISHAESWFQILRIDKWVYALRERLDWIDPRFLTMFANNYLIIGEKKAALIDTGIGIHSIKKAVKPLIKDKEIFVFNTHHHFDHVGNNHEWPRIYVHKFDLHRVALPEELIFLRTSDGVFSDEFLKKGGVTKPADEHYPLIGGEVFELGGIDLRVIHSPGHTPGSISISTSRKHLIAGDTIHNGSIYLPPKETLNSYAHSLNSLIEEVIREQKCTVLGGHEEPIVAQENIELLGQIVQNWQKISNEKRQKYNDFLKAHILSYPPFKFVIPD